jgi:two-component system response regulator
MTRSDPVRVLLVEDNPADARLAKEAFDEVDADVSVTVVTDGPDALDALHGDGTFPDGVVPHLILLDLHLPTQDGTDVLSEIKSDAALRRIPVIVLTTSDERRDVERVYDNCANAFITKPDTVSAFIDAVDDLQSFWLSTATLPDPEEDP